jgi:hypothetical protein
MHQAHTAKPTHLVIEFEHKPRISLHSGDVLAGVDRVGERELEDVFVFDVFVRKSPPFEGPSDPTKHTESDGNGDRAYCLSMG